ncbi:uncharacterized protein BX663DRAFT_556388 [Cokeromyces recurvatus]|uniref:uncharacterized protein n=1 Tax=Cokeromyces recurvatus TaxID=90255 RepID=UPI0022210BF6|nr:uncharacterized protein BX663DRAFT_556388 [Cokeromyces recurvatus]KAI7897837.1 hypothetical protein BX663DRAFT_556388 [Cokeromyces recurvatus]
MTSTAVRVGLRVRPLTEKELINNCTECLTIIPNEPQILIGTDKSFTYDYVFSSNADQAQVYQNAASPLLHKFLDGFNATILAYGQTGSGKTYSMGTSLDNNTSEGIIPRCIIDLFQILKSRESQDKDYKFELYVSFLELYNEEFIDLLNQPSKRRSGTFNSNQQQQQQQQQQQHSDVSIREDISGNIYWSGVKEEICYGPEDVLRLLAQGSLSRTTGSTEMNSVSSRSHAIFSIILKQQKPEDDETGKRIVKSLHSKFHFVDLAGSERLKRTHAQGERAKEGIAINSGLLALGNVISALGDETRKATHIPYRDSKLTRLLQDSLGGNSQTLMLACVSPADTNFMETVNTLKYANRARNIKNRVVVNQDLKGSDVNQLKALISRLRMEIATLRVEGSSSSSTVSSKSHHINEMNQLRERLREMSDQIVQLTTERDTLIIERELGEFMQNESVDDQLLENIGSTRKIQAHPIIERYQKTIQTLTNELNETKDKLRQSSFQLTPSTCNHILPKFSTSLSKTKNSSHKKRRKDNDHISTNSSLTTPTRFAADRVTTKINARHPLLTKSSSISSRTGRRQKRHIRIKSKQQQQYIAHKQQKHGENKDYINQIKENDIHHEEVKDSIAKARADIRKSIEVLELIKPLNNVTVCWEEEIKAFETEDKRIDNLNEIQRVLSDEGVYSLASSPVNEDIYDAEKLTVSTGDDQESKSEFVTNDYNSPIFRMVHQIQSDIKVKEKLVSHLERSENEYVSMREKLDEKINRLQAQLVETQKEKEMAFMKAKSGLAMKSDIMVDKQIVEIQQTYEVKIKNLTSKIHEWQKKYAHITMTLQQTKNQNESLLRSLKSNVEILKTEKKRLTQRMKLEADRVRDQISRQQQKIQQLQRRYAKSNQLKLKLERTYEQQRSTLKRCNDELLISTNQVKQLIEVMKKAVREGGILDEKMLTNLIPIMGGRFAVIVRGGGHGFPRRRLTKRKSNIPLEVRVSCKKELLDKALYQYIQGKEAVVEMEQLLVRRESLVEEKLKLEEVRKYTYQSQLEYYQITDQVINTSDLELIDERIDLISTEISYLSARIQALQSEAADEALKAEESNGAYLISRQVKHVMFADEIVTEPSSSNDEWIDIDTIEEKFNVPINASPELAYEITSKLIKSFEVDECKPIIENLLDDIMDLRMNEHNRQITIQNLEKTVTDLQSELLLIKQQFNMNDNESFKNLSQDNIADTMLQEIMENNFQTYNNRKNIDLIHHKDFSLNTIPSPKKYYTSSPNSPIVLSPYTTDSVANNISHFDNLPAVGAIGNNSLILSRESTPSPDRFYNMLQKGLPWQAKNERELINLKHYAMDRESSIPSTYSNNPRSTSNNMSKAIDNDVTSSVLQGYSPNFEIETDGYKKQSENWYQQPKSIRPPLMPSTFERHATSSVLSVFDRLAQTPTRAFRAKINYRHSSSSIDDLRKRWKDDQRPLSVNSQ